MAPGYSDRSVDRFIIEVFPLPHPHTTTFPLLLDGWCQGVIVTVFLCSFRFFFFLTRQQVRCLSTSWSLAAQVSRRVWKKQQRRLIKLLHVSLSILTLCGTRAEIKWEILPQENHQNAIASSRLSLTLFASSGVPRRTTEGP